MSKDSASDISLVVLAVCATVVTGLVVKDRLWPASTAPQQTTSKVKDWRAYANAGHRTGPAGAPVTIIEFSDFECPYCRQFAAVLDSVRAEFGDRIATVYRHYPLERIHVNARAAAIASECGAEQGHFAQMHDALYAIQDSLGRVPWRAVAERAGVPKLDDFDQCLSDKRSVEVIDRDMAAGVTIGLNATPTVLVNDIRLSRAPTRGELQALVREALRDQ